MDGYSVLISLILRMTVIILCVLTIKALFRSKLSPKIHMALWLIVCIQFVFCIFDIRIENSASIYNVVPDIGAAYTPENTSIDIKDTLVRIWLGTSAVMALWYTVTFINYRRKIKLYPENKDKATANMVSHIRTLLGIGQNEKIVIRYGDTAQTMPHAVILPEGFSDEELYHIILHELCHYRYKDHIKLWIGLMMLCLNWFNPLVWYAFAQFRTDVEMLCDDRVLNVTDNKKEYAQVLVKSAMVRSHFIPGAASVHNGKGEVKKRVIRIASIKKYKKIWLFVCAFVCTAACCVCLTDAVTVAVENTIEEVVSSAPVPVAVATQAPVMPENTPEVKTEKPVEKPKREVNTYTAPIIQTEEVQEVIAEEPIEEEIPIPAEEPPEEGNTVPEIGSDREEVYSSMGSPESISSGGSKETYQLEDGSTAVLQYDGDTLEKGYILN